MLFRSLSDIQSQNPQCHDRKGGGVSHLGPDCPRASPLLTTEKASLLQLEANLVDHFRSSDFMTLL